MFGLFKKKTKREKLQHRYEELMQESFKLSTINRSMSDKKIAQAEEVMKQLERLDG